MKIESYKCNICYTDELELVYGLIFMNGCKAYSLVPQNHSKFDLTDIHFCDQCRTMLKLSITVGEKDD